MGKEIPITRNGHEPLRHYQIESRGRIYPATPDGSQWEIRMHMLADFSKIVKGAPEGQDIIGEVVIRSFNGGFATLAGMANEAGPTTEKLVKQIEAQLEAAMKHQKSAIEIATEIPKGIKG